MAWRTGLLGAAATGKAQKISHAGRKSSGRKQWQTGVGQNQAQASGSESEAAVGVWSLYNSLGTGRSQKSSSQEASNGGAEHRCRPALFTLQSPQAQVMGA